MNEALYGLDLLAWVSHYGLVLTRTVGLFVFLPIFSSGVIPPKIRILIAMLMAFVFMPFVPQLPEMPSEVIGWTIVAVRELAAGFGLGVAARVIFGAVETAAQLISGQSGFALAMMVDPLSGNQTGAPNIFISMLTVALFLSADLHHMFIAGIHSSYQLLPPATSLPDFSSMADLTSDLGMRLFTVAVELAAPALIVTIAVDLVMVLVGKALPQIPILIVGYPFKMASGLVALILLVISMGNGIGWIGRTLASDAAAVIAALAGGR